MCSIVQLGFLLLAYFTSCDGMFNYYAAETNACNYSFVFQPILFALHLQALDLNRSNI